MIILNGIVVLKGGGGGGKGSEERDDNIGHRRRVKIRVSGCARFSHEHIAIINKYVQCTVL